MKSSNKPAATLSTSKNEKKLRTNVKAGLSLAQLHQSMQNNLAKENVTEHPSGTCHA